jgi:ribonuclease R
MGKTVIHSDHRFTYEEVQEIIETKEGLHKEEILFLNTNSQTLRKNRFKKGAINFASEEIRFKLDEHNVPIEVIVKESKECHQLIEELMLMANKSVAIFVSKQIKNDKKVPFPYRIHDTPDLDKLLTFTEFAKNYGYHFDMKNPLSIAKSFNDMVKDSAEHPEHKVLQSLGIRTMAKAVYATENIGHYGLAFEHYCHFTSPIRRYPDVLVHRVLLECLHGDIHPIQNMDELCAHCSEKERKAMESERDSNKYKQVEFIQQFIGDEFEAVITGVSSYGIWAQTVAHRCEGFVSIQQLLEKDEFIFIEEKYALVGRRSKRQFQIGQFIQIQVVAANLVKRQIDFQLV